MQVLKEIRDATGRLGLGPVAFRALQEKEARSLFTTFLNRFTGGKDVRWWWERFATCTSVKFDDQKVFLRLTRVVPDPDEHVWFVVEDAEEPFYPVFEATPAAIQEVIEECFGFEYYLIAKDLSWLLCENHHDYLIGIGEPIERIYTS
jgi:hypothetical protein